MKNRTASLGFWGGMLLAFSLVARGIPIPSLDLASIAEKADVIVIGEVISVTPTNTTAIAGGIKATVMVGRIRIDQVIKGSVAERELDFEFEIPEVPNGYSGVVAGSYRMVFLNKNIHGYSFANKYYPSTAAVKGTPAQADNLLDKISSQLGAVVRSATATLGNKQEALYALQTLKTSAATSALKNATKEKAITLQLIATAALLERNDISMIKFADSILTKPPSDVPNYFLHNIAYAISQGVSDNQAIPTLNHLLTVPNVATRRAAASALWHTHSSAAAKGLAIALNDDDFEVRFYSVVGLAEIAGQSDWHPNMETFQADQAKYVQHWHDWVLVHPELLSN